MGKQQWSGWTPPNRNRRESLRNPHKTHFSRWGKSSSKKDEVPKKDKPEKDKSRNDKPAHVNAMSAETEKRVEELQKQLNANSRKSYIREFVNSPYVVKFKEKNSKMESIMALSHLIYLSELEDRIGQPQRESVKSLWNNIKEEEFRLRSWSNFRILSNKAQTLIQNFVAKEYKSFQNGYSPGEFQDLHKILVSKGNKGVALDEMTLRSIVYQLKLQQEKSHMKDRFPNCDNVDDLLESFTRARPGRKFNAADLEILSEVTEDMGEGKSEWQIEQRLNEIYERKRLEKKEKELNEEKAKVDLEDLDEMGGHEFEDFLGTLFTRMGYQVDHPPHSRDQGADLIISYGWEKIAVQAKRQSSSVGIQAVQQVVASLKPYGCDRAIAVTTNEFTDDAIKLARHHDVDLWDRSILKDMVTRAW